MEHKALPPPYKNEKMKTFLEVEGKMGPITQPTSSQYRHPALDTTLMSGRQCCKEKKEGSTY